MTLARLIDPPGTFAPKSQLETFLNDYQDDPDPMVQEMVAEARQSLSLAHLPMRQRVQTWLRDNKAFLKEARDAMRNPNAKKSAT